MQEIQSVWFFEAVPIPGKGPEMSARAEKGVRIWRDELGWVHIELGEKRYGVAPANVRHVAWAAERRVEKPKAAQAAALP